MLKRLDAGAVKRVDLAGRARALKLRSKPLDILGHFGSRLVARRRIFRQRAHQHRFQGWRKVRVNRTRGRWCLVDMLGQHSHRCVGIEWHAAGQHFVEHHAKRVQVGTRVDRAASGLLRSHVRGGTDNKACHRQVLAIVHQLGDAEIGQQRPVWRRQ